MEQLSKPPIPHARLPIARIFTGFRLQKPGACGKMFL